MITGIRPLDALLPRASARFGAKAENLAALARAGFPVPAGFALSADLAAEAFARALPPHLRVEVLLREPHPAPALLAEARDRVCRTALPADLIDALGRSFEALQPSPAGGVVVRSSPVYGDLADASAAAHLGVALHLCSEVALVDAVRRCWSSVFDPYVAAYLRTLSPERLAAGGLGLVVQAFVPADVSGVVFTMNLLTADSGEMTVDATYGLGTVMDDERVTPDTYRVDKHTGHLRDRVIGDKRVRVVPSPGGGLVEEPVGRDDARKQALDERMLGQVVALGRRVEKRFGDAREIRFAIAGDRLYVLQAKSIEGVGGPRRRAVASRRGRRFAEHAPNDVVWSNVNLAGALPGVVTPLTWSVLSGFSELGLRQAFAGLGCVVPKDAMLVGNFRGRIYLNLSELVRIAAQVPGFRPASLWPLAGAAAIDRLEHAASGVSATGFLARLPSSVARYVAAHVRFAAGMPRIEREFQAEHARLAGFDLRILPGPLLDETLVDAYRLLEQAGSTMWTAHSGMLSASVLLQASLRSLRGEEAGRIQQHLLSGLDRVESAGAGPDLFEVVTAFGTDLRRHLDQGDEGVASDTPDTRGASERSVHALARLPRASRPWLSSLARLVHHYTRERERLRSHVVRVLGLLRKIALEASRRVRARETDVGEDAAFLLTLDELHGVLRGDLRTIGPRVRRRRVQLARDSKLPDPPETFIGYPPAHEAGIA